MSRIRVGWITSEYHPRVGGLERYVAEFTEALSEICDVALVTGLEQCPPPGRRIDHLGALNLAYPSSPDEWEWNRTEVRRLMNVWRPDVIHLASAGLCCYADALHVRPLFATIHCKDLTRPWQRVPERDSLAAIVEGMKYVDRVFCVSGYAKRHLERLTGGAVCAEVLTPGLRLALDHDTYEEAEPPCILTIGKMIPRKGHLELLRALERIREPFVWLVVGCGPEEEALQARIAVSPVRERVRMLGRIDDRDLNLVWSKTSLFAMTPIEVVDDEGVDAEGFGLVYLEAALRRIPSIGSIFGGGAEAIGGAETGVLVDPHDTEAVASAISRLLVDRTERKRLGEVAFNRAVRDFRWEPRVARVVRLYETAHTIWNRGEGKVRNSGQLQNRSAKEAR